MSISDSLWNDGHYLSAYQLSKGGRDEAGIAEGLSITVDVLRRWKKERPELKRAIEKGQSELRVMHEDNRDGLTPKQRRFVEAFVVDLHITNAAITAGYSQKSAHASGCGLLKQDKIRRAIQERFAIVRGIADVTKERVIRELALIAFANPLELFDNDGTLKEVTTLNEQLGRAIKSIDVAVRTDRAGGETVSTKIAFWDKTKALELLAKHLGVVETGGTRIENKQEVIVEGNPYMRADSSKVIEAMEVLDRLEDGREEGE